MPTNELAVVISDDPGEGIVAFAGHPLMCKWENETLKKELVKQAKVIAEQLGKKLVLAKFVRKLDLEIFVPARGENN